MSADPHQSALVEEDVLPPAAADHLALPVLRRNVALLAAVEVAWGFGMAVASFGTVVAFLLTRLGATERIIGGLGAASAIAMALPQLYAAYRTEHLPRKLAYLTVAHYPSCLAVAGVALVAVYADAIGHGLAIALVLACVALFGLSMGAVVPTWVHLLGKTLPEETRNTTWGRIMAAGPLAGLLGAWVSHLILRGQPTLGGYALCALVSAAALTLGSSLFWGVIEPPETDTASHETFRHFLGAYVGEVLRTASFRRLLLTRALAVASGGAALSFLSVAAKQRFSLPDQEAAIFTAVAVASQVVHGLWAGPVSDRWGNKTVCVASPLLSAAGCGLAAYALSPAWYTAAYLLVGGLWVAELMAVNSLVMAYATGSDKTAYIAATGTLLAPVAGLAPIAAGLLAEATSYELVFRIAAVGALVAGLAAALWLHEPKRADPSASR